MFLAENEPYAQKNFIFQHKKSISREQIYYFYQIFKGARLIQILDYRAQGLPTQAKLTASFQNNQLIMSLFDHVLYILTDSAS